jgi:Protein of unknown function (DUF2380)
MRSDHPSRRHSPRDRPVMVMWVTVMRVAVMLTAVTMIGSAGARAAPVKTAFLPFTLEDTSRPDPAALPDPADVARLHAAEAVVRRLLLRSGGYVAVNTKPIASAIAANDLVGCGTCAAALAREVGAQAVVTGWVQKVSDLIINMSVVIRSAQTGKMIAAGNASLRGDTNIAWTRGATWLVGHRLLAHEAER